MFDIPGRIGHRYEGILLSKQSGSDQESSPNQAAAHTHNYVCVNRAEFGRRADPHKRLLKRGSFSLPFRFCKSLCDFWPIREGVPQSVCGQDCCANLTKHVLHFPPPAPARHPIHIPRGKAFLQPRSCARRADLSTTSRVARPGNSLDLS